MNTIFRSRAIVLKIVILPILLCSVMIAAQRLPGSLDPTFGNGGKLTDWSGAAWEVAIQQDEKIIVAGLNPPFHSIVPPPNHNFLVARYYADGSPDLTFGGGTGRVILDSGLDDYVNGIAIQEDGKILLSGFSYGWGLVIVRLNANGSRDATFGSNFGPPGVAPTGCRPSSIGIQPDGKIVMSNLFVGACRHNADGSPDTSFGVGGVVSTQISTPGLFDYPVSFSMVIQADGKIVVGGGIDQENSNPPRYSVLIRYNQNGSLDTSFGGTGIVTTRPNDDFGLTTKVLFQPNGKIVALSESHVARYNADGSLDSGFGSGGIASLPPWPSYGFGDAALQTDGKIVVSGTTGIYAAEPSDFAIIRYNTNGSLDTTFGGGDGISTVDYSNSDDNAHGMALDAKGRAVVVGESNEAFAIARILLKSNPPFDYDGDGKTDFSVWRWGTDQGDYVTWFIAESGSGSMRVGPTTGPFDFGSVGIWPHPADYDGDGKTDPAHIAWGGDFDTDPFPYYWALSNSSNGATRVHVFGFSGDKARPADFDGDGRADLAVWRPSEGNWYILQSSDGGMRVRSWGVDGDRPVPADLDGDGKAELVVWRPSEGRWYIMNLAAGTLGQVNWGVEGDIPVVGDYSGDGKADFAVFRPSNNTWYRLHSDDYSMHAQVWGAQDDIPAPGDYDGDGRMDLAVFRPSEGKWYVLTAANTIFTSQFGQNGDIPTPSAFPF